MKPSSIRQKGQNGEREIAKILNDVIHDVRRRIGISECEIMKPEVQVSRNLDQSKYGGCDLINTYGLAIEVKRQETVNIKAWWQQTLESAEDLDEIPVLIWRKNRERQWHVMMFGCLPNSYGRKIPVQISMDDFLDWFEDYLIELLDPESWEN